MANTYNKYPPAQQECCDTDCTPVSIVATLHSSLSALINLASELKYVADHLNGNVNGSNSKEEPCNKAAKGYPLTAKVTTLTSVLHNVLATLSQVEKMVGEDKG
jgi:hypothetical protein